MADGAALSCVRLCPASLPARAFVPALVFVRIAPLTPTRRPPPPRGRRQMGNGNQKERNKASNARWTTTCAGGATHRTTTRPHGNCGDLTRAGRRRRRGAQPHTSMRSPHRPAFQKVPIPHFSEIQGREHANSFRFSTGGFLSSTGEEGGGNVAWVFLGPWLLGPSLKTPEWKELH
jgi:hypothetical protein